MDLSAYIEHFQSVLNEFDNVVTLTDNFLIWHFCDGMRLLIYA